MSWSEDHQQRHTIAPRLVFSCFFKFGYSFWSFWQQGKHPQPWQVVDRGAFGRLGGWFESSSDVAGKWVRIPRWENTCRDKITKAKSVGKNLRILQPTDTLQQKCTLDVCTAAPALQVFLVFLPIILSKKIWAKRSENTEESPLGGPTWGGFLTLMLVPFFTTNSMLQLEGGSWYFSNYISLMDEFQRCHLTWTSFPSFVRIARMQSGQTFQIGDMLLLLWLLSLSRLWCKISLELPKIKGFGIVGS